MACLICPTGAGCAVAVDLTTRVAATGDAAINILKGRVDQQRQQLIFQMQNGYGNVSSMPRWADSTATIVDGKVIITPVETDALYCLNLVDGKTLWGPIARKSDPSNAQSDERLYVACVHHWQGNRRGRLHQIEAMRLSDGKPAAWDGGAIKLPEDSLVCGRGFCSHGRYLLPHSSAQVAEIDLDSGKIVSTVVVTEGERAGQPDMSPWNDSRKGDRTAEILP